MPNLPDAIPTHLLGDKTSETIARTLGTGDTDPIVQWFNDWDTNIRELAKALNASFDFATDPGLLEVVLSQPTGAESLVASVPLGRYRLTAPSTVTDGNYRSMRLAGKAGVMGDSEVRSTWFAQSTAMSDSQGRFQPGHVHRASVSKQVAQRGTATTGATSTTLPVAGTPWTAGQWAGSGVGVQYYVTITSGTGLGQTRRIASNTTGALTIDSAWSVTPTSGNSFDIWSYNSRAVTLTQNVAFNAHALFNVHVWDNNAYGAVGQVDLGSYLKPGGTYVQFPWYVKTRLRGSTLDFAVWKGSDPETAYGTSGRSASFTIPAGWEGAGMSGLYLGHLAANDYLEFENLQIVRL